VANNTTGQPPHAWFRFYADLNDFLPPARRHRSFAYPVHNGDQSVKHLIEAIGVPHAEVELILRSGSAIRFDALIHEGDHVSVYPHFLTLAADPADRLRTSLPHPVGFLLDNHLGRLARYLRLLGFDTLYYHNRFDDDALAQIAQDQDRLLLTRDRGLLKRKAVVFGYCLRSQDSQEQLLEVLRRFELLADVAPWQRCLRCNGLLAPVPKAQIIDRLEPKTKAHFNEFHICATCQQIYWKGSHYDPLISIVESVLSVAARQADGR
jgi:uncharacterized protein with PIN domain